MATTKRIKKEVPNLGNAKFKVRRDEWGFAVAIERGGWDILKLVPGTRRNQEEVRGIVRLLNVGLDNC